MTVPTSSNCNPPVDPDQQQVAERLRRHGNVMVEAPPGSGKTFTGVYLALSAWQWGWTSASRPALFLTFSRNARVQIEHEVQRYRDQNWLSATAAQAIKISNYHAFYLEMISKRAGVWGCSGAVRPATIQEGHDRILHALRATKLKGASRKAIEAEIERIGSLLALQDDPAIPSSLLPMLQKPAIQGVEAGRPHYDDFAPLTLHLLKTSPTLVAWLRAAFPLVILDEYQDTDETQWAILQLWRPRHLAVFYDRYQMIYSFRGSSPDRPLQTSEAFALDPEAHAELTHLYRFGVQQALGEFVRELRKDNLLGNEVMPLKNRPWLVLRAVLQGTGPTAQMPPQVQCLNQIRWGKILIPGESTAVLTKANYLADYLQAGLSQESARSPGCLYYRCHRIGGEDSPDEALRNLLEKLRGATVGDELACWLGLLLDRLLVERYKVGSSEVIFANEWMRPTKDILRSRRDERLRQVRERLGTWRDSLALDNYLAFSEGMQFVLTAADILTTGRAYPDPEWYFYIRQLAKSARTAALGETWSTFCDRLEAAILSGRHFKGTNSGLTVLTIHQAKGREFDHVILPWLADYGEPLGGSRFWAYDYSNEEDRRLLYVALSRARNRVTIIYPDESPSPILQNWRLL